MTIKITKARRSKKTTEIERLAATFEPKLKKAFLAAIKRKQDQIVIVKIAEGVTTGNVFEFVGDITMADFKNEVADHFKKAASLATKQLPDAIATKIQFDLLNPEVVNHINAYTADLVTGINAQMKGSIQTILESGYSKGLHPYSIAENIKKTGIGLDAKSTKALLNFEDKLIANGATKAEIKTAKKAYYNKLLKTRTERIARTEALSATNSGQTALWNQAASEGLLDPDTTRRHLVVTGDERQSDICDNVIALNPNGRGLNEEFQTDAGPFMNPPFHPHCRTTVVLRFTN